MTKMTKRETLEAMIAGFKAGGFDADAVPTYIAYCEKEIDALDKKAAKAKETAAKKRAEGDELTELVRSAMSSDTFERIADIAARIQSEDITLSKVTYRLKTLVDNGLAEKSQITIPGGEGQKARKLMAYKLI